VLYVLANQVRDIGIISSPYLPKTGERIAKMLGERGDAKWEDAGKLALESGRKIGKPEILFRKIEEKELAELRERFSGGSASAPRKGVEKGISFSDLDLEAGEIVSVGEHPDAEKLYVEKVRLGDGEIQVVSGLVGHITKEELLGKRAIIVRNLAPAKLRGVESQGMLLVAEGKDGEIEVLEGAEGGGKVLLEGETEAGAREAKKTITFKEFSKVKITVEGGSLLHGGKKLVCRGGEIRTKRVLEGKVC
jgi:methionyl-tRNA synthetase